MTSSRILAVTQSYTTPFQLIFFFSCGRSSWVVYRLSSLASYILLLQLGRDNKHLIGLTLRAFYKRRIQFTQIISSNSSMNTNRYLRLMVLASVEMACTIPIGIYSIYISNKGVTLEPWVSWAETHYNFSYVGQTPAVVWRSNRAGMTSVELTRWLPIICALLFFVLFGFASEAKKNYVAGFWWAAKRFGVSPPTPKASLPESSRYVSLVF